MGPATQAPGQVLACSSQGLGPSVIVVVGATRAIRAIAVVTGLVFVLGSDRIIDQTSASATEVAGVSVVQEPTNTGAGPSTASTAPSGPSVDPTTVTEAGTAPTEEAATEGAATGEGADTTTTQLDATTSTVALDPTLGDDERFVDALSRVFLDRPALRAELDDLDRLDDALDADQRVLLARAAVEGSPWAETNDPSGYGSATAFERADGTAETYVDWLYLEVFGRAPDATGRQFWIAQMAGGAGPDDVAAGFADAEEFRRARVERVFVDVLGRQPDAQGSDFWTERLLEIDEGEMAVALAGGDEFYDRAVRQDLS